MSDKCALVNSGVEDYYLPKNLQVIIPVGGRATRLLPLTAETSKACLRLLNKPLVEYSLLSLASQGVRNIIFGVKGYTNYCNLYDYFESGYGFSAYHSIKPRVHIRYQPNVDDLGSADSARINMEYYNLKKPVFAVQGDNVFDINIKNLIDFHKEKEAALTIVLRKVDNVEGLGIADIDKNGRIRRFVEKPLPEDAPSNLANTGLYVISPNVRKIFKEKGVQQIIKDGKRLDFGYDFIPYVIEAGYPVYGYRLENSWFDVGTPRNYLEAMKHLLKTRISTLSDFEERLQIDECSFVCVQGKSSDSEKVRRQIVQKIQQKKIQIKGSVLIGRHCLIEDGAVLSNCCIDNFTYIGKNAAISNSAIMDRAVIGDYAEIKDSILGRHVKICSTQSNPTKISDITIIADDVTADEGCILSAAKVYPHQKIKGEIINQTIMSNQTTP
ncbi:MAG: NDP-sugar synthase [Candidatus Bathyarchaeota archaeon]|nr:NDP-sugar synthase [Candidatus Termiticorpusculum sp.]MCL1970497.1 NDP-sugar synthase [Candidatus Termiticorpusculum sp.]